LALPNDSRAATIFNYKSLKCCYTNVDSLSNKFDELKSRSLQLNLTLWLSLEFILILVIAILTLILQGTQQSAIHINQINVEFVSLYTHTSLLIRMSAMLFSESTWCLIPLDNDDCLLLDVIYHSPNSDSLNFEHLCSLLTSANTSGCSHLGDFNMPNINWMSHHPVLLARHFFNIVRDLYIFFSMFISLRDTETTKFHYC